MLRHKTFSQLSRTLVSVAVSAASAVFPASAEPMLNLYQRHRGLGDIEVNVCKAAARIKQENGNTFVISAPSYDVTIFNSRRRKLAKLSFKNFIRNGPKNIEWLEGATDWPLTLETAELKYKGIAAKTYALPFKTKTGQLVDLKHGKAGSYVVCRRFKVTPQILTFFHQMFHLQPSDGLPLKYVKIGKPFQFGHGLDYNRHEGRVTVLDTITAQLTKSELSSFAIPKGFKNTIESDVTMGDKTDDMKEIIQQLD